MVKSSEQTFWGIFPPGVFKSELYCFRNIKARLKHCIQQMPVYTNKDPPAFSCNHANLYFPQAHTCMMLQVVSYSICYSATPRNEARLPGSISVQAAATSTHLPDLLHSAAQNLAKHCHTFNVGTGCKLLPYFLDPPFLPSSTFIFIMPEVHSPKSRQAPFCQVWAPQHTQIPCVRDKLIIQVALLWAIMRNRR